MKNLFIGLLLCTSAALAQEIPQNKVPAAIVDSFRIAFPNASDIEWEQDGENYKVEFELGVFMLTDDHDVWFDKTGKIVKQKDRITKTDLPKKVLAKISSDFNDYFISDLKKITEKSVVTYEVKLKKRSSKLKITVDENGNVLNEKEE